jgi:hypothetical protein
LNNSISAYFFQKKLPFQEEKIAYKTIPVFTSRTVMEAMQTSSMGRQRKYSDVVEEDEATGGSGSESSRRSQRYCSFECVTEKY